MEMNEITIRRLSKVYLVDGKPAFPVKLLDGLLELGRCGYWLNADAYAAVGTVETVTAVVAAAKQIKGADGAWEPMYPNFPQQVINASGVELYVNAIIHYIGDAIGARIMPVYPKAARAKLNEDITVEALGVADDADLSDLVVKIMGSAQPFSDQDRSDLTALAKWTPSDAPDIPISENLAWLTVQFPGLNWADQYKTATDVLRLAVVMSDGDVSLAAPTKFRTFSRPERRVLLAMIEKTGTSEDLGRWDERWKRLIRMLRPADYKNTYPHAHRILDEVANGREVRSFNSLVEEAITSGNTPGTIALLSSRPGVFARRLSELLRTHDGDIPAQRAIVDGFAKVADKVSVRVLAQMWGYFSSPDRTVLPERVVTIKDGSKQKSKVIPNGRMRSPVDAQVIAAIESGIAGQAHLGKVSIDRVMFSQYAVPLGVRSVSSGARVPARGSRQKISDNANVVRLFIHWKDLPVGGWGGRVDIDLSAMLLNADLGGNGYVEYTNLRSRGVTHSGDITSAPLGAAEFIDIDIAKALAAGTRYVVMGVYSYSNQPMSDVPECYAGFMERAEPKSGEVFEPSTVTHRLDMTGGKQSTPFVFDLAAREVIVADMATRVTDSDVTSLRSNQSVAVTMARHTMLGQVMPLDRLLMLLSDGEVEPEDADVVFGDVPGGVAPWDAASILDLIG